MSVLMYAENITGGYGSLQIPFYMEPGESLYKGSRIYDLHYKAISNVEKDISDIVEKYKWGSLLEAANAISQDKKFDCRCSTGYSGNDPTGYIGRYIINYKYTFDSNKYFVVGRLTLYNFGNWIQFENLISDSIYKTYRKPRKKKQE